MLIKNQIGDIALIMQALISLLNPFQWHFTIITYLSEDMVDFLEAPVPYLIGVSSSTWEHIGSIKEYPSDIVIFDLETQTHKSGSGDFPELPRFYGEELITEFREIINRKERKI